MAGYKQLSNIAETKKSESAACGESRRSVACRLATVDSDKCAVRSVSTAVGRPVTD